MESKKLHEDAFPVKADREKIKTRNDEPVATAEDKQTAKDIAERLNDDEWRRHEDNWSA